MTDRLRGGAPWVRPCGAEDVEEIVRLASLMGRVGPGTEVMDRARHICELADHLLCIATTRGRILGYAWAQDYGTHLRTGERIVRIHDLASSRTIGAGALGEHCSPSFAIGRRSGTQPTFTGNPAKPPSPSSALGLTGDPCPDPDHPFFELILRPPAGSR